MNRIFWGIALMFVGNLPIRIGVGFWGKTYTKGKILRTRKKPRSRGAGFLVYVDLQFNACVALMYSLYRPRLRFLWSRLRVTTAVLNGY